MARVVVCGGSVIGLCTAMMLAGDGFEVTVLEADPDGAPATPADAWEGWHRSGVAQFHQPHNLFPRFHRVCAEELPGLAGRLAAAGCPEVDMLAVLPPGMADRAPRPGDERFRFRTGRRPVVEATVAAGAEDTPGLTLRRGVRVAGLLSGPSAVDSVPHVAGVRTTGGEELAADLVVDATGRRSGAPRWLEDLGATPVPTETEDGGFAYYTRYFTGPSRPERRGPILAALGSISVLTLDGDNDTWSVTVFGPTRDAPLKALRDPAVFDRVVGACPLQAHWLDGRALGPVRVMAGVMDRRHRFAVDGRPLVTGLVAVGDAWACTNPTGGRGLSVGAAHAQELRAAVRESGGEPVALAESFDRRTEERVAPFFTFQVAADRVRLAEMEAIREGRTPPPPSEQARRVAAAMAGDPVVLRAVLEVYTCLATPQEVFGRPEVAERLARTPAELPEPLPGPDRARLLELLAA